MKSCLSCAGRGRLNALSAPVWHTTNIHMSTHPPRPVIDNRSARNLFLARHGLSENPRQMQSRADLLSLIERIGFVQVDSINTVARAHDMILFARNQTYRPNHLKALRPPLYPKSRETRQRAIFTGSLVDLKAHRP